MKSILLFAFLFVITVFNCVVKGEETIKRDLVVLINQTFCTPFPAVTREECTRRNGVCRKELRELLVWVGSGSHKRDGKLVGDAGCQCSSYCGFKTPSICNKRKTCHWTAAGCVTIGTGKVGKPVAPCPFLNATTTSG